MKKNNNLKVRQSNHLIESPYSQEFSIHEIKLFEIALAECKQEDLKLYESETNKKYTFSNSELAKLLNTKPSVISMEIEKTAARIMKKAIHLRKVLSDGSVEFEMINIMPYAKYKSGILEFQINYQIIPYLVELNSNFTEFYLDHILIMNSSYGIKLYKLLYQYKNIKHRVFSVNDLKNQFGLVDKYPQYGDFKKNIINPAVNQINSDTDLNIAFTEIKIGRKVNELKFTFELKKIQYPIKNLVDSRNNIDDVDSSEILNFINPIESELSITTKELINKLINEKGQDYVEASIIYAKKNAKSNLDKYLSDTLTKGWAEADVKKLQTKKNNTTHKEQAAKEEQNRKNQQKEIDNLNKSNIEHEWNKLSDKNKLNYVDYANYIFLKQNSKLSRFSSVDEILPLCIYAVTNQKTYDRILEGYIINMLKISLNINDYIKSSQAVLDLEL